MFGASIVRQKREKERKERLAREEVATKSALYKQWKECVQEPPIIPYIKPFGVRFDPSQLPYFKYRAALAQLQVQSVPPALWYSPIHSAGRPGTMLSYFCPDSAVCTALFILPALPCLPSGLKMQSRCCYNKIPAPIPCRYLPRRAEDLLLVQPRSGGLLTVLRCAEQRRAGH